MIERLADFERHALVGVYSSLRMNLHKIYAIHTVFWISKKAEVYN